VSTLSGTGMNTNGYPTCRLPPALSRVSSPYCQRCESPLPGAPYGLPSFVNHLLRSQEESSQSFELGSRSLAPRQGILFTLFPENYQHSKPRGESVSFWEDLQHHSYLIGNELVEGTRKGGRLSRGRLLISELSQVRVNPVL